MSQRAYMLAARDHLRTLLSTTPNNEAICDVMLDGQPPPSCGETFVALWPGSWRGTSNDAEIEEEIGFYVTVTRRLGYVPMDRAGREVLAKASTGLEAVLEKIIKGKPVKASSADWGLHMNYVVMAAANATITASYAEFHEPVRFLDGGRPEPKGPDWFSAAEVVEGGGKYQNAGLAQTLTFGQAKRCQGLPQHNYESS